MSIISSLLFLGCLGIGFYLASHKAIWIDEMYNQIVSVAGRSYWKIIFVDPKSGDGNVAPLFHFIQKVVTTVAGYLTKPEWLTQQEVYASMKARIVLRITSVMSMSAAVVAVFYYFSRRYSLIWGIYSFLIALASFMVWAFWAEARPYALFVFFTTLQSLLFLELLVGQKGSLKRSWQQLCVVHVLLASTAVLSLIQLCSVCALLWLMGERDWKKYIFMFLVPLSIGLYYYSLTPQFTYYFKEGLLQLLNASFSKERMLIAIGFLVLWGQAFFCSKKSWKIFWQEMNAHVLAKTSMVYFLYLSSVLVGFFLLFLKFKMHEDFADGFQFPNRYFISLAPIGIIATTLFSIYIWQAQQNKVGKVIVLLALGGVLIVRLIKILDTFLI